MSDIRKLENFLLERIGSGAALAFSGGVDSSVLLEVLRRIRLKREFRLVAMTMHSLFQRTEELEQARNAAAGAGVELRIFECDPLRIPGVAGNPPDRCYHCKRHFFQQFRQAADASGIPLLLDGTNADDLREYRPGLRALRELGVVSPLAETAMTKAGIRAMAAELGLKCATVPAAPCLATRFEYGTHLSRELIDRVAAGEEAIRRVLPAAETFRLRVHGATARIEVPTEFLAAAVARRIELCEELHRLGFDFVALDLDGFRSGSMDVNISREV